MSRTTLQRGKFRVSAGWDEPCQHFFADIETPDDEDEPWYCTMFDPQSTDGGFDDLNVLKEKIHSKVGILPDEFWNSVAIKDMTGIHVVKDTSN